MPFHGVLSIGLGKRTEIEPLERKAEVLSFSQDRQPGQARLKPLETQLLEQTHIVDDGSSPLFVMVAKIVRQIAMPGAAPLSI